MYTLTLTHGERRAIDFVGHRYSNGDDLFKLLWCKSVQTNEELDWDSTEPITFKIPEHVAWQIAENANDEDGSWPLFAPELAEKMQSFVDNII